jgi:predicted lipoprotein with Yx(FWY)xxD motif
MSNAEPSGLRKMARATAIVCVIAFAAAGSAAAAVRAHMAATTTVSTQHGKRGVMLAAANGHTLYMSTADKRNKSNCTGSCTKVWAPLTATGGVVAAKGSGVKQSLLGTILRSGGKRQVTYNGHPLYLNSSDKKPGQMHGENAKGFSATWYAVNTSGNAIKPKPGLPGYY